MQFILPERSETSLFQGPHISHFYSLRVFLVLVMLQVNGCTSQNTIISSLGYKQGTDAKKHKMASI